MRAMVPLTVCVIFVVSTCAGNAAEFVEIGLQKQLFVDDHVIAGKKYVTRTLGRAVKENNGQPIFADGWFYGTVLHDDGKFKMWARQDIPDGYRYEYSESVDGLHFTRVAEVTGIYSAAHSFAVSIDPHETDPTHRYKAAHDAPGTMAGIAHSADGIRWIPYNSGEPVTHRAADTYNQILWDEAAQTYRLFTRTDFGTTGGSGEIRGNREMVNPDVKADPTNWTMVREWMFDREGKSESNRRQLYGLTDWIYCGVHFGLMSVFEWPGDVSEGPNDFFTHHERDVMNFYIATSRDGDQWDLSWVYAEKPIIPRGGDGAFDNDIILPSSTIVTHDDRHWLYYGGANERHGTKEVVFTREHAIGLATIRLDGFISLTAGDKPGTVLTKPFKLEGGNLHVNVDAAQGKVRVDVLDVSGKPLAGYSGRKATTYHEVDELRLSPRWSESLSEIKGRVIRLRFNLTRGALYSFQVEEE